MNPPLALVVEDDRDLSDIFSQAMMVAGYQTEVIQDGKLALQRLDNIEATVIVLDLHLPNVSGEVILEKIHADPRFDQTRIIITTADAVMAEMVRDQADIVLVKPITFGQLRDLATRFLPKD
jgi:two-component system OmpR family response regulator